MIAQLFVLIGIFAITLIVSYAHDEIEVLHEMKTVDSSLLKHNLFQFLTLMPTVLIFLQIMINMMLILLDSIDEVFFYIRENGMGIFMLKGVFGLSLLLLTGMLVYLLQEDPAASDKQSKSDDFEDDEGVDAQNLV